MTRMRPYLTHAKKEMKKRMADSDTSTAQKRVKVESVERRGDRRGRWVLSMVIYSLAQQMCKIKLKSLAVLF